MKTAIISLFIFLVGSNILAQPGCLDPLATNFNPLATSINSSCSYPTSNANLETRIASLPTVLNEASALLVTDGKVFTINDSGNAADLFEIDSTTGVVKKKTRIKNYNNVDWEDLTADSIHIYIADFGNNNGDRTDLRILKVKKSVVYHPDSLNITAERLRFSYPDQSSFVSSSTHNFDCESIFFLNGRLHLFSKNRGDKKTKHYSLNPNLPNQIAILHDSLNVNGLITSASIRKDGKVVVLLGLDQTGNLPVFAWLLFGFEGSNFFDGNRRRIELPNVLSTGQAEGIGFASDSRLWVSNEKISIIPAAIKELNIAPYINSFFTDAKELLASDKTIKIYPNPVSDLLTIELKEMTYYRLINSMGKEILSGKEKVINVSELPNGLYFISYFVENKAIRSYYQIVIQH